MKNNVVFRGLLKDWVQVVRWCIFRLRTNQRQMVFWYILLPIRVIWPTNFPGLKMPGGKILQGKKQISEEYGFMAVITDSEGNRVALHSRA